MELPWLPIIFAAAQERPALTRSRLVLFDVCQSAHSNKVFSNVQEDHPRGGIQPL